MLTKIPFVNYPEPVSEDELDRAQAELDLATEKVDVFHFLKPVRGRYLTEVRGDGFLRKLQFAVTEGILDELLEESRSRIAEIGY